MTTVWLRNDGLVGHGSELPRAFGDCSFSSLGEFANTTDAEIFIMAIPGIIPNKRGFWKIVNPPSYTLTITSNDGAFLESRPVTIAEIAAEIAGCGDDCDDPDLAAQVARLKPGESHTYAGGASPIFTITAA